MKQPRLSTFLGAVVTAALLFTPSAKAQSQAAAGNVTFTVTAVGKKNADVSNIPKDDVQLFQGKDRKQIGDWKKGDSLFLAILIDDSIESSAGGQWDYLREFIMAQPPSTAIMVGYITDNGTRVLQDFTPNHELAAKALRLPIGIGSLGSSPYLGTLDLLKRWPKTGPRRSVILITSGIDFFRGPGFGTRAPSGRIQTSGRFTIRAQATAGVPSSWGTARRTIWTNSPRTPAPNPIFWVHSLLFPSSRIWMKLACTSAINIC